MNQSTRRLFLIQSLLRENPRYAGLSVPKDPAGQRQLLRALMNVRAPKACDPEFLEMQDAYLADETAKKGVTDIQDLTPVQDGLYVWQGDITALRCDAIVNAANSQMLGCFVPCHGCIDNAIHTYAGVQLRLECARLMTGQEEEPTGNAKITKAYNLPCRYILHTVGPIISEAVTQADRELLASCYRTCLELAAETGLGSIAFCCISTGEFHFPNELAAEIAIQTVGEWQRQTPDKIKVIFNVFKNRDYEIYKRLLR